MKASYLVRFDDLCPTMNWDVWDRIEPVVYDLGIRPICAIVPDNQDDLLRVRPAREDYWDRVRAWQARGWTIALHGYQHRYVTDRSGIVGLNRRSEFAGLPSAEQEAKLRRSVEICREQGVTPKMWTAPSHSFDATTIRALRSVGLLCINEGFYLYPHVDPDGMLWVPHQLWRFHRMPVGVWTVGFHFNLWMDHDLASFAADMRDYRDRIVDFGTVVSRHAGRRSNPLEPLGSHAYLAAVRLRLGARRLLRGGM